MTWENLKPAWRACFEEAWTAYGKGSLPIGAVVVNEKNEIVSRGRNRTAPGEEPSPDEHLVVASHELAHAEMNALIALRPFYQDRQYVRLRDFTLYTTMEPCPLCMGALYMAGPRHLVYAARDPYAGSTNLLGKTPYLSKKPISVEGPVETLELVSISLMVETILRQELPKRAEVLTSEWRAVTPLAVVVGERLFESGKLQAMGNSGVSIAEVFDLIEEDMKDQEV